MTQERSPRTYRGSSATRSAGARSARTAFVARKEQFSVGRMTERTGAVYTQALA